MISCKSGPRRSWQRTADDKIHSNNGIRCCRCPTGDVVECQQIRKVFSTDRRLSSITLLKLDSVAQRTSKFELLQISWIVYTVREEES
jgi:hypothetical protein